MTFTESLISDIGSALLLLYYEILNKYDLDRLRIYQYNRNNSKSKHSRAFFSLITAGKTRHERPITMTTPGKRFFMGKGKGYLNAAGPQYRFIIFLIFLLIAYTILLRVFQKLAEIVQLPVFLPVSLVTLLVFIGIVGVLYSHTFAGPIIRIRRALDRLAEGDTTVNLRLRESDDPMLKDLVASISRLCEHTHNSQSLVKETAQELFKEIAALQDSVHRSAGHADIQKHLDSLRKKQDLLDKAIKAPVKA